VNTTQTISMDQPLALPGQAQSHQLNRIHETSARLQRYQILFRRRWWFLLLTASIGVCVAAVIVTGRPEEYKSVAKLVAGGRMTTQGDFTWVEQLQDFYGTIIDTVQSPEMKQRALARIRALYPDLKDSEVRIQVVQNRGSAIFNVFATGQDQEYPKIFLQALMDEFIAFRQNIREQGLERALNTFIEDFVKRGRELQDRGEKLEAFRKANNVVLLTNGNNDAAAFLQSLRIKKEALITELNELRLALEDVDIAMVNRERAVLGGQAAPGAVTAAQGGEAAGVTPKVEGGRSSLSMSVAERNYLEVRNEVFKLNNERANLLKSFKEQHPAVVALDERIESAKRLLNDFQDVILKEFRGQISDMERRQRVLDEQIAIKEKEALELGAKLAEHERLEEEWKAAKLAHDQMAETVTKFQQMTNIQTDYVAVQEPASEVYQEEQKLLVPLTGGLLAGLAGGMLVLLLFDRLDDRMNSFAEFQALFPGEAVLGQIPEQKQRGDVALLQANDTRHLYAEAFRNVRSSILFKNWQGNPPKTILVTSAVPNEGKTTVTSNLAITMALGGARVLLADCDLRRGGVSELFKLPNTPGLSEVLRGQVSWRDALQDTGIPNLKLLARGEVIDQTSEVLLSKTAETVLREMAADYDYVIFDSAPVLVADDTGSFAPKLDTVLFVVRMSSTMARLSGKALDTLYERQVNVGGVILNRSSSNLKEYTYYNYASYYYTPAARAAAKEGQSKEPAAKA